jgi:hypothetical protein
VATVENSTHCCLIWHTFGYPIRNEKPWQKNEL